MGHPKSVFCLWVGILMTFAACAAHEPKNELSAGMTPADVMPNTAPGTEPRVVVSKANHRLSHQDLLAGQEGLEAMNAVAPGMTMQLAMAAIGMMTLDRSPECLAALAEIPQVAPEMRLMFVVRAHNRCDALCPRDLESLATMSPADQLAHVISECDAQGADPLFSGSTLDQRMGFSLADYLYVRMQMDALTQAVEADGTSEAKAILAGYRSYQNVIAGEMTESAKALEPGPVPGEPATE